MTISISHIGMCVSDLERSRRFYCEGLGFEPGACFDVGDEFGPTLEVPGEVAVTSQFIARDGCSIELLHYAAPGVHGRPAATRNQLGFTHLCVRVDDVEAVAARLVECGGTVLEPTRYSMPMGDGRSNDFVFIADPDGVRVELMQLAR